MKRIVLQIGHGGNSSHYDSGAIGADGTHEHKFNRDELHPLLSKELEDMGFEVVTIIQEKSFGELPDRINALNPDVILSLHFNAFNGSATGSETLHYYRSRNGLRLAKLIQDGVVKALGLADRGCKGLRSGYRGSALVKRTRAVAVILEPFFGDNPNDLATARENLGELARNIAKGVGKFLDV